MAFAYWMVLAAAVLPYATVFIAKRGVAIDNRAPRASLDQLRGWRQRADWAHRNHFEIFPLFAAGVIVAELTHAPQTRIDLLAGAFVLTRLVYTALYVADRAAWRSIVFVIGFALVVALFVAGVV